MRFTPAVLVFSAAAAQLAASCTTSQTTTFLEPQPESGTGEGGSAGEGGGSPASACTACLQDSDCDGAMCAQFGGDAYCAPDCSTSGCDADRSCILTTSTAGNQVSVCVPNIDPCGDGTLPGAGGSTGEGGAPGTGGEAGTAGTPGAGGAAPATCGVLDGPSVTSCCHSCSAGYACQANGCYGGWYCNRNTCKCLTPPDPSTCGDAGTGGSAGSPEPTGDPGGPVTPSGGKVNYLKFAIVGDTRPPTIDDTAGYPTAVVDAIWTDVQNESPRPSFAITTGDYMFASTYGSEASAQLDRYLDAQSKFANTVFYTLGNHECTGYTASNCGINGKDGTTKNYQAFLSKMIGAIGKQKPYYDFRVDASDGTWSAKFVVTAANAWDSQQASWLETALAKPTTYTFVVRHEPNSATTAPGVTPSNEIIAKHPLTLLIAGHSHTYYHSQNERLIIVGNGGAPLTGSVNYGYVIATQRTDGAIVVRAKDYASHATISAFVIGADGAAK